MTTATVHFAAPAPGFLTWLIAHWPTAGTGCRVEFGHASGRALHWLTICHPRQGLRHWPVLVSPATGK